MFKGFASVEAYGGSLPADSPRVEFIPYNSADDLAKMLAVIDGSIGAGNKNSGLLKVKRTAIIEELARIKAISHGTMVKLLKAGR